MVFGRQSGKRCAITAIDGLQILPVIRFDGRQIRRFRYTSRHDAASSLNDCQRRGYDHEAGFYCTETNAITYENGYYSVICCI